MHIYLYEYDIIHYSSKLIENIIHMNNWNLLFWNIQKKNKFQIFIYFYMKYLIRHEIIKILILTLFKNMRILTCIPIIMSSTTYCNICDHTFSTTFCVWFSFTYYNKHIHTKKHINNTKKKNIRKKYNNTIKKNMQKKIKW